MTHIVDNVFLSSCEEVTNFLGRSGCDSAVLIVGNDLNYTIPLAIFYIMMKYSQTYEAARNFVLSRLDRSAVPHF
jgi:hypothetical protein